MNLPDSLWSSLAQIPSMPTWAVLLSKATLLLAIIWTIHFTLARVNPRWRVLLWRGAVVGLGLLVFWTLGVPDLEVSVLAPEAASTMPSPFPPPVIPERAPAGLPQATLLPTEVPTSVEIMPSAHQSSTDSEQNAALAVGAEPSEASMSWRAALLGIWGLGTALLLVRLATGYLRLARVMPPTSQNAPEWVLAEVQRIAAEIACHRAVLVRSSQQFAVPFLYGLRRPVLVLPERMCRPDYRSQLPGIVAHELTHLRSRDFGWNVALQMVSILLWFHPLAWRIGLAHRAACDATCDAVSASYLGDVQVYCRMLARVALEGTSSLPAAGLAMARSCDVRRRVAALQHTVFAMPLRRRSMIGCGFAALLAVMVLSSLQFALAESQPEEPVAAASEAEAGADKEPAQEAQKADPRLNKQDSSNKDADDAKSISAKEFIVPAGICDDGDGGAVEGAEIVLYQIDWTLRRQQVVARIHSDAQGRFRFAPVPGNPEKSEQYGITATAEDRASQVKFLPYPWQRSDELRLSMPKASVLRGRVRDSEGRPIEGAKVSLSYGLPEKVVGVRCALTDEHGNYAISDLAEMRTEDWSEPKPVPGKPGRFTVSSAPPVYCRHPRFGHTWTRYQSVPGEAHFNLEPAGVIDGRVVYAETSEPAVGIAVCGHSILRGVTPTVKTDEHGRYRLKSLRPEKYNISTRVEGWTARAIDSFQAASGEARTAPDLKLVRGGIVKGRLVDADTGEPMSYADFVAQIKVRGRPFIRVQGPARPRSGPGCMAATFQPDGSYSLRVPPGDNFVRFYPTRPWRLVRAAMRSDPDRSVTYEDESIAVSVNEGDIIIMDFAVRLRGY